MVNLSQSFRDPAQITGLWNHPAMNPKLLEARADKGFTQTLGRLGVTLLVTREYEHLVLALEPHQTTWMALPHPSGLLADRSSQTLHIACTRNPNLLMELKGETLLPTRARFLPGSLYLHELALIGKTIYANAVGQNAIVSLDYTQGAKRVWWPAALDGKKQAFHKNYLQLNSIAAGKSLKTSFSRHPATGSSQKFPATRGNFPVDRQGRYFFGGDPRARGLGAHTAALGPSSGRRALGQQQRLRRGGACSKGKVGALDPQGRMDPGALFYSRCSFRGGFQSAAPVSGLRPGSSA